MRPSLASESGLASARVVLPGSHDTASAVAAVPARGPTGDRPDWCYISLGTWALLGVESPRPVIDDRVLKMNFTNEVGVNGTIRLLKNIAGLWLVQECRRAWKSAGKDWDWEALYRLSETAEPMASFINPDAAEFAAPGNMPEAVREFCRRSGQPVPADEGAILRCVLESLAMRFRQVLEMCEQLTGGRIEAIHVVGGGSRVRQLCQATADACGRCVLAGPVEATAIGNVMVQAVAIGDVASIAEAREMVRRSFPVEEYVPKRASIWNDAYGRFVEIVNG